MWARWRGASGSAPKASAPSTTTVRSTRQRALAQPWWLDWTAGLFPVILVVFMLRSFLFEPFKIPSGSMIPTLLVGDLILVNKFTYGLRLPVLNVKLTEGNKPQRGDVMVFRYPPNPNLDYIKRVVGLPGDEVAYLNKRLTINGQPVDTKPAQEFFDEDSMRYAKQLQETLGAHTHNILVDDNRPAFVSGAENFPGRDNCRYSVEGVVCKVPENSLFHDGRQPRQFARLALLGVRAGQEHRRQGVLHLDELRQLEARRVVPIVVGGAALGRPLLEPRHLLPSQKKTLRRPASIESFGMNPIQRRSRQRGISFIGLIIVAALVVFAGIITAKVIPTAIEYQAIRKAAKKATAGSTVPEVRAIFDRAAAVDDFNAVSGKDLDIKKNGDRVVVGFAYDKEIALAGPAYLLIKYNGSASSDGRD